MRWRVLFFLSLAANLALAVWLVSVRRQAISRDEAAAEFGRSSAATVKTNVVIRRQFFSWTQVESEDYQKFIANLREIDCPEQTIRDIIIADVNALFAKRIATDPDIVSPEQQWWRSEPDPELVAAAERRIRMLDTERRTLLSQLLGSKWETGDLVSLPRPTQPGLTLDGPVLGYLPADVKQSIQDISQRANERLQNYLEAQRLAGKNPDPAEMARLRQEIRQEFARVMTPPQLEEFLLRYSQASSNLRNEMGELKYFNASPEEFRAVFRATDSLDQQLEQLSGKSDANSVLARNQLLQQRESAVKQALGKDRYQEFLMLHDPQFRDAVETAQKAGASPETAQKIYELNQATAEELARIRANTNYTVEQRTLALKQAELEQLKANAQALGQELPAEVLPPATPAKAKQPDYVQGTHPYVLGIAEGALSVGARYGVSAEAMQSANPGVDFKKLRPGDSIKIPSPVFTPSGPPPPMPPPLPPR
ncbi:MAG: LysM domain-containing protein [Verrucomicrobiota bacterium]